MELTLFYGGTGLGAWQVSNDLLPEGRYYYSHFTGGEKSHTSVTEMWLVHCGIRIWPQALGVQALALSLTTQPSRLLCTGVSPPCLFFTVCFKKTIPSTNCYNSIMKKQFCFLRRGRTSAVSSWLSLTVGISMFVREKSNFWDRYCRICKWSMNNVPQSNYRWKNGLDLIEVESTVPKTNLVRTPCKLSWFL